MDIKIRSWNIEDAERLAETLNNKNVQDNLRDGIPFPYKKSNAEEFIISTMIADKNNAFTWAITVDNIIVGSLSVFRKENIHRLSAEMGYFIAEDYWGKGICADAVRQAIDYISTNTDIIRIFAEPFADNIASCRVLEKAGFLYEGTLKKNAIKNGVVKDMKIYSIIVNYIIT